MSRRSVPDFILMTMLDSPGAPASHSTSTISPRAMVSRSVPFHPTQLSTIWSGYNLSLPRNLCCPASENRVLTTALPWSITLSDLLQHNARKTLCRRALQHFSLVRNPVRSKHKSDGHRTGGHQKAMHNRL